MKTITNICCSAENLGIKLQKKQTMTTFMHKYSQMPTSPLHLFMLMWL